MTIAQALLAKLSEFDFTVVIDRSGSMLEPVKASNPNGPTRWAAVQESAMTLIRDVSSIDSDGLGLVVFGGSAIDAHDGVTVDKFREIFAGLNPRGGTPLAQALESALALAGKSEKKDFIVFFTDGVPDDQAAVVKTIVNAANGQETDDALTILFVQVGDDAGATAYLRSLDDDLKGAKHDIVDVKTVAEADQFATTAELIAAAIDG